MGAFAHALASDALPPLRVDPALLGGAPLKPKPAPAFAPAPAPKPVEEPAAAPAASAAPAAAPAGAARQAPAPSPVDPAAMASTAPAREDPTDALAVARQTEPPALAERPPLPPLYSAHVAAGVLPSAKVTPFAQTDRQAQPTRITAHRLFGINDVEAVAEGAAVLERGDDRLYADRIVYRQDDDEVLATGNVRLVSPDTTIAGPRLRLRLDESSGEFESPAYTIRHTPAPIPEPALTMSGLPAISSEGQVLATTGRMLQPPTVTGSGAAERIEFLGENRYRLLNATYSTCTPEQRDWEVKVDALDLDYDDEVGQARGALVTFKGLPLLYSPRLSFALSNQRKSGFLAPTIGSTSTGGLEAAVPWYWNIAPNMDATITPRALGRRGVQLGSEFRYLDYRYSGLMRAEYLPNDRLARRDRYAYTLMHVHNLGAGFGLNLNVNRVSDGDYYSDLSTRVGSVTQGSLLRQALLTYAAPWYSAILNVQSYQTLQGLAQPHQRLPQLIVQANRFDLPLGFNFHFTGEYVNFDHPTQVLARRTVLYPQISLPFNTPAFWLTPKLGIHHTRYQFERQGAGVPAQQSRSVPIFSVDGGFVLERDTQLFGRSLQQTLEPRAYYVYVPARDKIVLPQPFDTGRVGFNYANMFRENRYAGNDRIGDANEITLAATSRLIDPTNGAELLRATLGTRYYFANEKILLPGETGRTERKADILGALIGQVLPKTFADLAWQYNPRDGRTERMVIGGRYRPEAGKIFNASYRFARDGSGQVSNRQIDASGQWRLAGGWHGVGRYNYSLSEKRVIESIGGVEYNAGCWVGRFVVQRLATIAAKPTSAIFFQIELNDFSRIGTNPLDILKRNIPGYGVINQPTANPVFAEE